LAREIKKLENKQSIREWDLQNADQILRFLHISL
jgi:hypothetical protein